MESIVCLVQLSNSESGDNRKNPVVFFQILCKKTSSLAVFGDKMGCYNNVAT